MVIRCRKSKDRQHKSQMKTNKQLPIKQTSHIKLTIQQQELHSKHGVNSGASEERAVPDALMTPVALFLYMVLCYRTILDSVIIGTSYIQMYLRKMILQPLKCLFLILKTTEEDLKTKLT